MQRHQRDFHGESCTKGQEQPELHIAIELARHEVSDFQRVGSARCFLVEVAKGDDASQHEQAASRCKEHKFESGINTALASPTANQEVGWDQHHFPEDVEEEEVSGQKNT